MIKIGDKNYLTIKDYAKLKGVTIQTVYNWIKNKEVVTKQLLYQTVIQV